MPHKISSEDASYTQYFLHCAVGSMSGVEIVLRKLFFLFGGMNINIDIVITVTSVITAVYKPVLYITLQTNTYRDS